VHPFLNNASVQLCTFGSKTAFSTNIGVRLCIVGSTTAVSTTRAKYVVVHLLFNNGSFQTRAVLLAQQQLFSQLMQVSFP
jgi:hypothetical protein